MTTTQTLESIQRELTRYCGTRRGCKARAKRVKATIADYLRAGFSEFDAARRTLEGLGLSR